MCVCVCVLQAKSMEYLVAAGDQFRCDSQPSIVLCCHGNIPLGGGVAGAITDLHHHVVHGNTMQFHSSTHWGHMWSGGEEIMDEARDDSCEG